MVETRIFEREMAQCHNVFCAGRILHAGGVLKDASLAKQSLGSMREVWAPKMQAIQCLQQQAWGHPMQDTVLFSSTAALLGPPGQANYAAANAALNALSQQQQSSGKHPAI